MSFEVRGRHGVRCVSDGIVRPVDAGDPRAAERAL